MRDIYAINFDHISFNLMLFILNFLTLFPFNKCQDKFQPGEHVKVICEAVNADIETCVVK